MKISVTILFFLFFVIKCFSQYKPVEHREILENEIVVETAGSYSEAGKTYVLANDITSKTSTIFLGKDVILDLNGYSIKYAVADYEHISNSGFEEGLKNWDVSKAPGAKIENTTDVHVFLGEKLLRLKAGDEITSSYVYLPVANRSYFAICGITGHYYHDMEKYPRDEMRISIYVEDEKGNEVKCKAEYGDGEKLSCPVENKIPRLGGGFIYAHLTNLATGKYRVRLKAETDCLVDEIDIRPAMDAGISIIEKTTPLAHYDHVIAETYPPTLPSFYDFTEDMKSGKPFSSLAQVNGSGTIIIKNGTIESGTDGILSWGIQSSAPDVKIVLENVQIKTSGISSGAADIPYANIKNCSFDVNMPFLIQRHVNLCSVLVRGDNATEISSSEFIGGQGCLSVKGKYSQVHDNLFVNNQTVTNHYSIMGTGDNSKIYNNRFEPKQGSGIYVSRYTEVFDNVFKIETSPPTCEYGNEEYSTAAIRLGDYGAKPGSPNASAGSRIHGNKIYITAKNYPKPEKYLPMAWGIFYSACGGDNYIYDNEIVVNKAEPESRVKTAALYICGGPEYFGGQFYNNKITTNVPAAWIATMYGGASNSKLYNNTIIPLSGASFKTFQIGFMGCDDCVAKNVEFRSNQVENGKFEIDATKQDHIYSVYWTLTILMTDEKSIPLKNAEVKIFNRNAEIVSKSKTDDSGVLTVELPEYMVYGEKNSLFSPYTLVLGEYTKQVLLDRNLKINWNLNQN